MQRHTTSFEDFTYTSGYIHDTAYGKWDFLTRHKVGDEYRPEPDYLYLGRPNWRGKVRLADSFLNVSDYRTGLGNLRTRGVSDYRTGFGNPRTRGAPLIPTWPVTGDSSASDDVSTNEEKEEPLYPYDLEPYEDSDSDSLADRDSDTVPDNLTDHERVEDRYPYDSVLTVEYYDALEKSHAKELFSAFVWAVAKTAKRCSAGHVDIGMTREGAGEYDGWKHFTLQSSQLAELAENIQSTGLHTLQEAYLIIIPPFSFHDRLPQLSRVVEHACEQGKKYERLMLWKNASDAYGWLMDTASSYARGSFIYKTALAIAIQYLDARRSQSAITKFYDPEAFHNNPGYLQKKKETEKRLVGRVMRDWPDHSRTLRNLRMPRAILHGAELHSQAKRGDLMRVRAP